MRPLLHRPDFALWSPTGTRWFVYQPSCRWPSPRFFARTFCVTHYHRRYTAGANPWGTKCDVAAPCATQNEIGEAEAKALVANGVRFVVEGANMPTTAEGTAVFESNGVAFGPAKAVNAGGVSVSGLEMAQNSSRLAWTRDEVDRRLKDIMANIYKVRLPLHPHRQPLLPSCYQTPRLPSPHPPASAPPPPRSSHRHDHRNRRIDDRSARTALTRWAVLETFARGPTSRASSKWPTACWRRACCERNAIGTKTRRPMVLCGRRSRVA